jgi:porphobilinogen synthase
MSYPKSRGRRLRKSESLRKLTSETRLHLSDFVYPIFVSETINKPEPILSMPGIFRYPYKHAADEAARLYDLGILSVVLFGIPAKKDLTGSESVKSYGIVQKAISEIKSRNQNIIVMTDVCLCEYMEHGHCGILKNDIVDNDATIKILAKQAVSHAHAGADIVAPSAMMDGQVGAIRQALDDNGFSDTSIMAYSAKYSSAFYGPFRDAAQSAPEFGDRKGYQMNFANFSEALKEIDLDMEEGADIVMVKPALAYLDIIARAKSVFDTPIAAYNVSGEYSMVKMMAANGIADEKSLALEILTSIKRAGADIIISYHAPQLAEWLKVDENH